METMGITRVLILFFLVQTVIGSNNTSSVESTSSYNSSERLPKALLSPHRRVVSPTYNKPVSNVKPNFPLWQNSVRSDIINPYRHYETTLNHHATRSTPMALNVDPYRPYISREGWKNIYAPQKQYYGNAFDASGYKIVSDNPMASFLYKKPVVNEGYSKLFSPSMNYFNSPSIPYSVAPKTQPETANFSQLHTRAVQGDTLTDQYLKTHPDIKSYLASPTFSPGLISPGGFKPINSPQLQSNPQVSEHVRIFNTEPKTIYSTSFNNPGTVASVENFRAYPTTLNAPNRGYQNPQKKISGNYQPLSSQPQLLFHGPVTQRPSYHSQPLERIRSDVEVINKPNVPVANDESSDENDDDDNNQSFEEGFKIFKPNSFGRSESYEYHPSTSLNNKGNKQKDFSSPFFASYDKGFGKYSSKITPEQSSVSNSKPVEKPEKYGSAFTYKSQPIKYVYEHHGPEDYSSSHESYEHQDGSENHYKKALKTKKNDDEETEEGNYRSDESLPHHKSYRHDFTDEFVDAYRREIPSNEYSHVKEVPEIDESEYKSKIVSVSGKKPVKIINRSHEIKQSQPTKQPYVYSPTVKSHNYEESSGEDEKTVQLMVKTPFGHKLPRQKSRTNGSNKSNEASSKQAEESVKKAKTSTRPTKRERSQ